MRKNEVFDDINEIKKSFQEQQRVLESLVKIQSLNMIQKEKPDNADAIDLVNSKKPQYPQPSSVKQGQEGER